jgi:hypothetical protein
MKKILVLLFLIIFLCSCTRLPYFESDEDDNLIDAENGRLYVYSGSYLRAAQIIREPYARYDGRETLHAIPGIDPSEWLSENIDKMGLPLLFRDSGIEKPELESFGTERIHVTQSGEINIRVGLIEGERVQVVVDDFVHGDGVSPPVSIEHDYLLYFESPEYPGIYFVLNHFTGSDGQAYLYDRWTKRAVICRVPLFGGN